MLRSETHSTGTQHRKSSQGISLLAQALPPGAPFPQDVISLQVGGWVLLELGFPPQETGFALARVLLR